MTKQEMIKCINYVIKEYLNDREMFAWFENTMTYYRNRLNENATPKQAFDFVIQSPLSTFHLKREEEQQCADYLWAHLLERNHRLTKIW